MDNPTPTTDQAKAKGLHAPVNASGVLIILVILYFSWPYWGPWFTGNPDHAKTPVQQIQESIEKSTTSNMQRIYDQVAADAVAQYEIANRNGSNVDRCVHAGLVSAAYIQAKNEAKYAEWKKIEKRDCDRR